jgi:hypothetical protein
MKKTVDLPLSTQKLWRTLITHEYFMLLAWTTYRIHLKVDQFSSSQRNDNLPLIHGTFYDRLFAWRLPFIHTLIRSNVTNTIRIDLEEMGEKFRIFFIIYVVSSLI